MFIGEIGINHNGDINTALHLIDMAKECGIDVVKFQKRNPDVCIPESMKNTHRIFNGKEMTYLEYKHQLEFGEKEYDLINQYCKQIGIKWTASVWDVDSVKFMERYKNDIPFIKIPSACITDMELIDAINNFGVPVLMSNGMSTEYEIAEAIDNIHNLYGILHCNSSYPSFEDELDLNVIPNYKQRFPQLQIGFSSHCTSILPIIVANMLGADIIEAHITYDKLAEGTDHKCSLDIGDLSVLKSKMQRIEKMLGNEYTTCYNSEKAVQSKLRKR